MSDFDKEEIKNIFGITKKEVIVVDEFGSKKTIEEVEESEVSDSDIYDGIGQSVANTRWEDKVENIIDKIPQTEVKDTKALPVKIVEEAEKPKEIEKTAVESVIEMAVKEKAVVKETVVAESIDSSVDTDSLEEDSNDIADTYSNFEQKDVTLDQWYFASPSPKFERFYSEKQKVINTIIKDEKKKLNFNKIRNELINSCIDVTTPIHDLQAIHEKMQKVQGLRDRVTEIQILCNGQYYLFETMIDLLEGLLARVECVKPLSKQNGLIHEHMGDVKVYFSELKDIHRSAEIVAENLNNAYDTLSRQLTIALPQRPIERYFDKNSTNQQPAFLTTSKIETPISKEMESFDKLEADGAVIESKEENTVFTDDVLEKAARQRSWKDLG